jgi:hypothetical protein
MSAAATAGAATAVSTTATVSAPAAAASGELDARLRRVVLFVEDVERSQADVGEFLLAQDDLVVCQKILCVRYVGGRRSDRRRCATGE